MILKQKSCTYQDGWHGIEPCPHRPPASCRTREWLPCPLAHTPEEVRRAGTGRGGRPIHLTRVLTKHKKNMDVNAHFL
jgi:hypothetical protein